jgi:hypothetical protein
MMEPTANGRESASGHPAGFGTGFVQPLGIYMSTVALFALVQVVGGPTLRDHQYRLQGESAAVLAVGASLLLGLHHHRRSRERKAAGVLVGTFVWPIVLCALFVAFVAYRISQGGFV